MPAVHAEPTAEVASPAVGEEAVAASPGGPEAETVGEPTPGPVGAGAEAEEAPGPGEGEDVPPSPDGGEEGGVAEPGAEEAPAAPVRQPSVPRVTQAEKDAEWRRAGTMEFESPGNKRTEFGRVGPDSRVLLQSRLDEASHLSPRTFDPSPTQFRYALDVEGYPLHYRNRSAYPVGGVATAAEMKALEQENPDVLAEFQRCRAAEWRWEVSRRRSTPNMLSSWLCYMGLCGDPPGTVSEAESQWPGRERLQNVRHPVKERVADSKLDRVEIAPAALEFRRECFKQLTAENKGKLPRDQAVLLAQFWGYIPSELDKRRFAEKKEPVPEKEFNKWLDQTLLHPEDRNLAAIKSCFKNLDFNNKGTVSEFAFRCLLKDSGEELTDEQIDDIINRTACRQDQKIKYDDFIEELWAQNRKLPSTTVYTQLGIATRNLPNMTETEVHHF
ncbi:hypothetical protein GNI_041490 [Gregarina niphandrodes]|uniref:EF-hand domain-containing protein n=1 Tax=Gregarina niphandrodes TaxID=110365 RepID=A0A023BA50_GRENI|nr:hypothetical protein GNI_041490 [Gregarina niphandrodes]EZG77879.1 hypothetical protein GNI_041490 [Gregarina niphandrodes]|eukprot:XP_011129479.1 hypothetical protein GNI_041490 [Gregarina niphandrodes]